MYANLLVHVGDEEPRVAREVVLRLESRGYAHVVDIHLDDPENEGSHAEPCGVETISCIRGPIRITANF